MAKAKILTFETWVTHKVWYDYALAHPEYVPHLLIDRSPCQDPFFDTFASSSDGPRPLVSGLCRCLKWFAKDDLLIYVTRVASDVADVLGIPPGAGLRYLGVAALRVVDAWESHRLAADDFSPRRYVASPATTPYPPNLSFEPSPVAAAARASSIVYSDNGSAGLTADQSTDKLWERQYRVYRHRQKHRHLRVARCNFETSGPGRCLELDPEHAVVVEPAVWGGTRMSMGGVVIDETTAGRICALIAAGR